MRKLILYLLFLIPAFIFAQSGKIAGVVTDEETGEPLVGVNIILDNTTMGAMTGLDGYYVILNVPASSYDIRANYIGYKDVVFQGVRVSSNTTTNQNFELTQTALELEEAVVVRAERPLVEKNVTQSYSLVTTDQIDALPVRGLNSIIALQSSVVLQDGAIHIRGGRSDEVGYYLDGLTTSNLRSNTNAVFVVQEAIEEVQVLTGGYTAEFGGANSGMVRTQLKTGTPDFHASLDFQTDKFASSGEQFLGTYSYRHHIASGSISGPITNNIRFFIAGENNFMGDDEVRFSKGFNFVDLIDQEPNTPADTLSLYYPNGFTPDNERDRWSVNGSVLFDFNPVNLKLTGSWTTQRQWSPNYTVGNNMPQYVPWINVLRDRQIYDDLDTYLLSAKLTHILSPTMYYDVTFGLFSNKTELGDEIFGHNWQSWYDSAATEKYFPGANTFQDAWEEADDYILSGIPFSREGKPYPTYRKEDQSYFSTALNFTGQFGKNHEVKFGGDVRLYTVRRFTINPGVMKYAADSSYGAAHGFVTYGNMEAVPAEFWMINGVVNTYGYDIYGNELNSDKIYSDGSLVQAPKEPVYASAYVQDKMEYGDLIINAGLRMDYFDPDDQTLKDVGNATREPGTSQIAASDWKDIDPYVLISPRLGFSFPVNTTTVFYFQYGKFAQMPQLSQMYFGTQRLSRQILDGGNYYPGPIGFDLEPIKTTNYEVGFRKQVSDFAALDVTGFYRNVKGQIQSIKQSPSPSSTNDAYDRYTNGDFATTKGLELKLTLRRFNRLQASLNYTLTDAAGSGSNSLSYRAAAYRGSEAPTINSPLDYEQVHRGSVNLDYRFGANDGGFLENSGANILFTFNSGHPYTKVYVPPGGQVTAYDAAVDYMNDTRNRQAIEPLNDSVTPWNFNFDLRLDKTFQIGSTLAATVYMRVNNLFNTKNVINVYTKTGNANDDGFLNDPLYSGSFVEQLGQDYVDLYKAVAVGSGNAYRSQVGNELFGQPRQIFFGIKLVY